MILQNRKKLLLLSSLFLCIYALISIVNHYNFRTYALDLGLFNNALWDYARLKAADSLMIHEHWENLLGGHFGIYLMIFSPFSYIMGTYTLLIIQIIFIIIGGIGVYKYVEDFLNPRLAIYASLYFFLFFGIYSALAYDYHNNVIAAMLLPYLFWFLKSKKFVGAAALVICMWIAKENISLWLIFVFIGLMPEFKNDKRSLWILGMFAFGSAIYFMVITKLIIPTFSSTMAYRGFLYSILGLTPGESVIQIILHPYETFKILFINHTGDPAGDGVKQEFLWIILLSGLFFLIRKPAYIIMLIPLFAQKLFHDIHYTWGIGFQYNIEFAPILAIGIFDVINSIRKPKLRKLFVFIAIASAFGTTYHIMDHSVQYTNKAMIRFYHKKHYQREYNVKEVHKMLNSIPKDAVISAQSPFTPHLALRDKVYQYPLIKDAEFIIISQIENPYPMNDSIFTIKLEELLESNQWKLNSNSQGVYLFQKK